MKWWKRCLFSLISLAGGFFSLDYQILAFGLLTRRENWEADKNITRVLWQIGGAGMFMLYAVVLMGYFYLIRKNAALLPTYQLEKKKKRWIGPRFEMLLQLCVFLTGLVLRFGYLLYIYLPGQFK